MSFQFLGIEVGGNKRSNKRNEGQFQPRFSLFGIEANLPIAHTVLQGSVQHRTEMASETGAYSDTFSTDTKAAYYLEQSTFLPFLLSSKTRCRNERQLLPLCYVRNTQGETSPTTLWTGEQTQPHRQPTAKLKGTYQTVFLSNAKASTLVTWHLSNPTRVWSWTI